MKQQDLIASFNWHDLTLTMYWDGATKGHKARIDYEFTDGGVMLMQGDDFCTPEYPDSIDAVVTLLAFLCVMPGETEADYFKTHTPEMLEWLNTPQRDELNMYVGDYESYDENYRSNAMKFFDEHILFTISK